MTSFHPFALLFFLLLFVVVFFLFFFYLRPSLMGPSFYVASQKKCFFFFCWPHIFSVQDIRKARFARYGTSDPVRDGTRHCECLIFQNRCCWFVVSLQQRCRLACGFICIPPVVTFIAEGINYVQTFKFWRARSIFKPRILNRCTKFTNPIITIATYYLLINVSYVEI